MASKTPGQLAREYFSQGYSCSESAWLALTDDLDKEQRNFGLKLAGSLSGGCGNGTLCGAVAGSLLGIGRWFGREMGEERKAELKTNVKRITDAVKAKYKSLDCNELRSDKEDWQEDCAAMLEYVVDLASQVLDEGDDDDCG